MLIRIVNKEDPDQTASEVQFSDNALIIRAGIHKMLVRIANRELIRLLLKKQSELDLHCLFKFFLVGT